ncbi:DUF2339 domain-containing protein [Caenimonas koreensis]|nr:DUF2339 domain-containing protein [Caenimonas koreensis]
MAGNQIEGVKMVVWSAIWGALFAMLAGGHDGEWRAMAGAVLGALAGLALRGAVRKEVDARMKQIRASAVVANAAAAGAATRAVPVAAGSAVTGASTPAPAPASMPASGPAAPTQATPLPAAAPRPRPAPAPALAKPDPVSVLFFKLREWLFGGNTVLRMGVVVLFVGLAFLAKYAIDNSLLPPELRLAGIAATGIALFVVGLRLRNKAPEKLSYALSLQGAGVAVLYLTVFAAFRLYQFLPAGAAFAALGLICAFSAVIALAQNAQVMAFIGFAGGFAAPILVSTGQGNHVSLFSYYLLLGVAIAAIAWLKAWRPLNLLGFFATFGVATAWGALKYQPENFATTEPFLIAFFIVYVAASVMYATRHSLAAKRAVDGTLAFGVPIVSFGLQVALVRDIELGAAFSSLALGAFYLALGWWMARRKGGTHEASRWLAECYLALGLGFVTLAVPLALDARWTSAVWAVEGAAVFWMGRRQDKWLARATGLALQAFAAASFLSGLPNGNVAALPFANPVFLGAFMLAASALAIAWWTRVSAPVSESAMSRAVQRAENALAPAFFWLGFLWWQFALNAEIGRTVPDLAGAATRVFDYGPQVHLRIIAWVASAYLFFAVASRKRQPEKEGGWAIALTPAWFVLPVLFAGALHGASEMNHVFEGGGWIAWPLLLAMHYRMLSQLDRGRPQAWWPWVHAASVWLLVYLVGNLLVHAIGKGSLWHTAWATVILLVAGTLVLLLLSRRAWFGKAQGHWPLDRFQRAYLWLAAAPVAVGVALGALVVAVHSDGNAKPLPYVPLLNPTDLSVGIGLAACALWLLRVRQSALQVPATARDTRWVYGLLAIGFVALNTVWLRVAHHFFGVDWNAHSMFASFLVQAGYSILWTLLALALMVSAHRRGLRSAWMLGAGLLGMTVLKLFVIDLSNRGGSERIFVFIAVGVMMLVVGYFAPLPPQAKAPLRVDPEGAQA